MLEAHVRKSVIDHVLRHLVPNALTTQPMNWFQNQFTFLDNAALQDHLAEAYYQARLAQKLRATLELKGGFNHLFLKTQIILYASIYEALVDYAIERHTNEPATEEWLSAEEWRPITGVFGSKTSFTFQDDTGDHPLVPCIKKSRSRKLVEIRFSDRLRMAAELGYFGPESAKFVDALYKSRNRIHLVSAAKEKFSPDASEAKSAFTYMQHVLSHYRKRLAR